MHILMCHIVMYYILYLKYDRKDQLHPRNTFIYPIKSDNVLSMGVYKRITLNILLFEAVCCNTLLA